MKKRFLISALLLCLVLGVMLFASCAPGDVTVKWTDADGTIIKIEQVASGSSIPSLDLPEDSDEWHYTGWKETESEDGSIILVAERVAKNQVLWLDADGTEIEKLFIVDGEDIPTRPLPEDSDEWHYTEWRESISGKDVTYTAERTKKILVEWLDSDGTVLKSLRILDGEEIPGFDLPKDTDAWDYLEWEKTTEESRIAFIAERELKSSYFVGNVFQIIVKDLGGNPIATGTGFVFDEDGYFVTNNHVMDAGYEATAIFEIRNSASGDSFTSLEIKDAVYHHADKDVFIGKITDYHKISSYYREMPFATEHEIGDATYSVGYPNSSVKMEVHAGEIVEDISNLYDKLYSGNSYICSTSYIAPGSSGGILVSDSLEILGMTTLGFEKNGKFALGGSIDAFNYVNQLESSLEMKLQDFALFQHPEYKDYIIVFRAVMNDEYTFKKEINGHEGYAYQWSGEDVNDKGIGVSYEEEFIFCSDMYVYYKLSFYWETGDSKSEIFAGYYSPTKGIGDFTYVLAYVWEDGEYYAFSSDNINYSPNLNLTLQDYDVICSDGIEIHEDNVMYVKDNFNLTYEFVNDWLNP